MVFVAVLATLRGSLARRLWCLGALGYELFFVVVVLPDQARYTGAVFVLWLAAVWLAVAPPGRGPAASPTVGRRDAKLRAIVVTVLAAQVVALLAIAPSATVRPFSPDRAIADAARAAHVEDTLVSGEDFDATAVSGYLDRPSYSVARQAWIRFFVHDDLEARRSAALSVRSEVCAAAELASRRHRPAGLITEQTPSGPGLHPLAVHGHVALYRVDPSAARACPGRSGRPA